MEESELVDEQMVALDPPPSRPVSLSLFGQESLPPCEPLSAHTRANPAEPRLISPMPTVCPHPLKHTFSVVDERCDGGGRRNHRSPPFFETPPDAPPERYRHLSDVVLMTQFLLVFAPISPRFQHRGAELRQPRGREPPLRRHHREPGARSTHRFLTFAPKSPRFRPHIS